MSLLTRFEEGAVRYGFILNQVFHFLHVSFDLMRI